MGSMSKQYRVKCFNCKGMGHFSRDCPSKQERDRDLKNSPMVGGVSTNLQPRQQKVSLDATALSFNREGGRAELCKIEVKCALKSVNAIIDSGAEISVVREGVVPEIEGSSGRVTLTGAFGDSASALLRHVPMGLPKRYVEYIPRKVPILCAVTDCLVTSRDMLLTPDDYDSLKSGCGMLDFEPLDLRPEDKEEAFEASDGCVPDIHGETRESMSQKSCQLTESSAGKFAEQKSTKDSERCGRRLCGSKIKPRGPTVSGGQTAY